jgi:hypothetical protein
VGSVARVLFLGTGLGNAIFISGGCMARKFHLNYATRVAVLIGKDPAKWVPIWKHHMTQYLGG